MEKINYSAFNSVFKLYTDGGSRGNPGHAASAWVIYGKDDEVLSSDAKYIGETTNNIAEYCALVFGLENAADLKLSNIECYSDSELMVKQINGQYKVKDQTLATFYTKIIDLKNRFETIKFIHVRRESNKLADKLVNECLDSVKYDKS